MVPYWVVTATAPLALPPTVAAITESESTEKLYAAVPPKLTDVAPVKPVPRIVTPPPIVAEAGVKLMITGAEVGAVQQRW